MIEETNLTRTMNRAAREIRANREEAANWWHLADGAEELARELAYQLSRIGVDLAAVQTAAAPGLEPTRASCPRDARS